MPPPTSPALRGFFMGKPMAKEADPNAATAKRDLPLQTREAPVVSVDAGNRTAALIWTTGAAVKRYDWWNDRFYMEVLSMDPAHVRMDRLASGKAPVLNTHGRYSLEDVLGVVTSATLGAGDGRAEIKFSQREDVAPVVQDVADGIICNVSVGYAIHRVRMVSPAADGELWRYEVIDWEPQELSLVPIGADAGGVVESMRAARAANPQAEFKPFEHLPRNPCEFLFAADAARTAAPNPPAAAGKPQEETAMTDEEKRAAEAAKTQREANEKADRERIATEARAAERTRLNGIREAVQLGGLDEAFARTLCDNADISPADAGLAVLREQAKRASANPTRSPRVEGVRDQVDTVRASISNAIVLRLNPGAKLKAEEIEMARSYRHMSLVRMAEETLFAGGINVRGLSGMEIAGRALHTTSDFPSILANVLNKRLRMAYEEATGSYKLWARRAPNAPDFKQMQVTQLGAAPDLLAVAEGGEFKYGTITDGKEVYSVATYGRIVSVSRQLIVNDDLRAFDRLVAAFGSSAARLENRIVYGILTANAAMGDTVALFHATHGNLASPASAISVASLGAGRSAMRLQKGLQSEELNVTPRFLIGPTTLEQTMYQFTSSNYVPATPGTVNEFRAGGRTALEPIVEPVLDANSATAWYLASDSGAIDTVEFCYLDGSEGVYTENEIGFDVDGMKLKARLDFAAKAIDHRGLYKNAGT